MISSCRKPFCMQYTRTLFFSGCRSACGCMYGLLGNRLVQRFTVILFFKIQALRVLLAISLSKPSDTSFCTMVCFFIFLDLSLMVAISFSAIFKARRRSSSSSRPDNASSTSSADIPLLIRSAVYSPCRSEKTASFRFSAAYTGYH